MPIGSDEDGLATKIRARIAELDKFTRTLMQTTCDPMHKLSTRMNAQSIIDSNDKEKKRLTKMLSTVDSIL